MQYLLKQIKACTLCEKELALGPRPIVNAHSDSKIIIIGQAPGSVVHKSGIPWDDQSGKNLRNWMGIDKATFHDEEKIALMPMGFCYPGMGKSGDLPPIKRCAPLWHPPILSQLKKLTIRLLIGTYAQEYYLPETKKMTLTACVKNFESYLPYYFVLPHPSPRNNIWQKKHPWFVQEVLPVLKNKINGILAEP